LNTGKDPMVSVVIPLYNEERYVAEAMHSALNQSFADLEVLVIDDKSTDHSLQVASRFLSDGRVRILTNSENRGVAYSQNRGIKEARGKVLALCGADDVYHRNKLKTQIHDMCVEGRYRDVVVYSDYFAMDGESRVTRPRHLDLNRIQSGNILGALMSERQFCIASIIFLIEGAFEVGLFDENLKAYEDYDFILKLAKTRAFIGIPTPLYGYRFHTNSLMYKTPEREKALLKLKIMEKHLRLNPDLLRGKDGAGIRRQLARSMMISRSFKSAFHSSLKDPRMLEEFCSRLKHRLLWRSSQ